MALFNKLEQLFKSVGLNNHHNHYEGLYIYTTEEER